MLLPLHEGCNHCHWSESQHPWLQVQYQFLVLHSSSYLVLCIGCNSTLCAVINTDEYQEGSVCFWLSTNGFCWHEVLGQTPPELTSMMFPKEPLAQCNSLLVCFCKIKLSNPNLFTWLLPVYQNFMSASIAFSLLSPCFLNPCSDDIFCPDFVRFKVGSNVSAHWLHSRIPAEDH